MRPPAEFGEKTSVVINASTRSGQGLTTPTGSVTTSYGSFGTSTVGINVGYGGPKWGNFISTSGLNTGRFLDPPEFTVIHAKGNEENVFDRVDYLKPTIKVLVECDFCDRTKYIPLLGSGARLSTKMLDQLWTQVWDR